MAAKAVSMRRSIADIQSDYDKGNKAPLEKLMRAWKGIKALPPDDPNSFFAIGGYHGEPFRGQGATDAAWWGGYCQHGTVLFPTWHRAYLWRLEQALQSIPGCADVALPFWDECDAGSQANGIPRALTDDTFELDGAIIPNPLKSFVLPAEIDDQVKGDPVLYSKPVGYETVRYPLSGLVGPADAAATKQHNDKYPDVKTNVDLLNKNISAWLSGKVTIDGSPWGEIFARFQRCLDAPSYTIFSNTTSAAAATTDKNKPLVSLEEPHNYMHLAVGGFDYPGQGDIAVIPGANGDMGENDTAGLDPIFFFHHCFIDYVFWIWQQRHGATKQLAIDAGDPGTKFSAQVAPPAGMDPNDILDVTSPLDPFVKGDGSKFTSTDCADIEGQLGYTYGPGSLDAFAKPIHKALFATDLPFVPGQTLRVSGINRGAVRGSFLVSAFTTVDGKREYVGTRPILSRWHVAGCMNCQNHLEATAVFRVPTHPTAGVVAASDIEVEVITRDGLLGGSPRKAASGDAFFAEGKAPPFKVQLY